MSRVCKYYLKGVCKYGARCHFVHEDPSGYDYNYQNHANATYNSVNKHSAHRSYSQQQHNSYGYTYSRSYSNNAGADYRSRSEANASTFGRNYDRYHVDRRNQKEAQDSSETCPAELLDVIIMEIKQFENGNMWPITVIAPAKSFGNIPGFRDCSPEEMRHQYYQSLSNGTVERFHNDVKQTLAEIMRHCQLFKVKSNEALQIVNSMIQRVKRADVKETTTEIVTSSFTFDLSKCPQNISPEQMNFAAVGATPSNTTFSFGTCSSFSNVAPLANSSPFFPASFDQQSQFISPFSTQVLHNQLSENSNVIFGNTVPCNYINHENSMSGFSFDINKLKGENVNSPLPSVTQSSVPSGNSHLYSKLEELPPHVLEAFQAKSFKIGEIPLTPPPQQLCFNSY